MEVEDRVAQTHDVELVLRALERWIQGRIGFEGLVRPVSRLEVVAEALDELLLDGLAAVRDAIDGVWIPSEILWRAARRLVEGAAQTHADGGELIVPIDVRRAIVDLARPNQMFTLREDSTAGGTVADPFCGLGLLICDFIDSLWESKLRPESRNAALLIYGADPNPLCVRIATALLRLAPSIEGFKTMVDVELTDAASDGRNMAARVLISSPPFGRKLLNPVPTRAGSTRNGDEAQIERCTKSLREGGHAVILTTQAWLTRRETVSFRHALATEANVVAVIGLPARALGPSTSIASAITVIRRADPSETLVADLEEDWREQLSASGNFFQSFARLTDEG
jgi:type I restriction-modification system DNA methylase subunit